MTRINQSINNLPFDAKIRAESSLSILAYVDEMLDEFMIRNKQEPASVLLDVFGLLQSLFVGIDALYQLSFSTTKYKYHVNINANRNLRMLKYIRNDVVGHPTHRNYQDGSFGFSKILEAHITREKLTYETYIIKQKLIHKKRETIHFKQLLQSYQQEKIKVLQDLNNYLSRTKVKVESTGIMVSMFEKGLKGFFDQTDLDTLHKLILKEQNTSASASNRFNWRIELLHKLFEWTDDTYQELIEYLRLYEILHLYQMNLALNNQKLRVPKLKMPPLFRQLKDYFKGNKKVKKLTEHLHELNHPLFGYDLGHLIEMTDQSTFKAFFIWFQNLRDSDHSYVVGKAIKLLFS